MVKVKTCKQCGKTKPLSEFYSHYKCSFGVRSKCKICESKKKIYPSKKCHICGKEFIPKAINQKNCSSKCRYLAELKRRSNKPKFKICQFCNKEFIPYTSLTKFCSAECRINNIKSKRTKNWHEDKCEKIIGKNNPGYRNGLYCRKNNITSEGLRKFQKNGKELINDIINSNGYLICQYCGTSNTLRFEKHHIIFRSEKPNHKHLHIKDNILLLCIKCHNEFHKHKSIRNNIVKERKLNLLFGDDILNK